MSTVFGLLKSSGLKFIYSRNTSDGTSQYLFDSELDDPVLKELRQVMTDDLEEMRITEVNQVPE